MNNQPTIENFKDPHESPNDVCAVEFVHQSDQFIADLQRGGNAGEIEFEHDGYTCGAKKVVSDASLTTERGVFQLVVEGSCGDGPSEKGQYLFYSDIVPEDSVYSADVDFAVFATDPLILEKPDDDLNLFKLPPEPILLTGVVNDAIHGDADTIVPVIDKLVAQLYLQYRNTNVLPNNITLADVIVSRQTGEFKLLPSVEFSSKYRGDTQLHELHRTIRSEVIQRASNMRRSVQFLGTLTTGMVGQSQHDPMVADNYLYRNRLDDFKKTNKQNTKQ